MNWYETVLWAMELHLQQNCHLNQYSINNFLPENTIVITFPSICMKLIGLVHNVKKIQKVATIQFKSHNICRCSNQLKQKSTAVVIKYDSDGLDKMLQYIFHVMVPNQLLPSLSRGDFKRCHVYKISLRLNFFLCWHGSLKSNKRTDDTIFY